MSDFTREAVISIIESYKQHECLYNINHKLYYNKQARNKAEHEIAENVRKIRPETTCGEVHRKIQTLRTQFQQEKSKIERSKANGDESLIYVPKIFWYKKFEWIAQFMKKSHTSQKRIKVENQDTYTYLVQANDDEFSAEILNDHEPPQKVFKKRRMNTSDQVSNTSNDEKQHQTTIEYIISPQEQEEEDTSEIATANDPQLYEIHQAPDRTQKEHDCSKFKRKSKAFGKYIGSLMQEITDEKLFFNTQTEILKIIEKATLQLEMK